MERIYSLSVGLLRKDEVVGILGQRLLVLQVDRTTLDFVDEILIEVSLANVASCHIVSKSAVGERFSIRVNEKVVVDSPPGVMSGEDGLELSNSVGVGLLNTAAKCR